MANMQLRKKAINRILYSGGVSHRISSTRVQGKAPELSFTEWFHLNIRNRYPGA